MSDSMQLSIHTCMYTYAQDLWEMLQQHDLIIYHLLSPGCHQILAISRVYMEILVASITVYTIHNQLPVIKPSASASIRNMIGQFLQIYVLIKGILSYSLCISITTVEVSECLLSDAFERIHIGFSFTARNSTLLFVSCVMRGIMPECKYVLVLSLQFLYISGCTNINTWMKIKKLGCAWAIFMHKHAWAQYVHMHTTIVLYVYMCSSLEILTSCGLFLYGCSHRHTEHLTKTYSITPNKLKLVSSALFPRFSWATQQDCYTDGDRHM